VTAGVRSIADLEALLRAARVRSDRATQALARKHKGGEWEESRVASEAVLDCERALAAAKGEAYAAPLDFPVQWDIGAPLPHLIQSDYQTFLIFMLRAVDPNWDGSYVNVRSPSDQGDAELALVEFKHCVITKMGMPNDELASGHPLSGRGYRAYAALKVENSNWIRELENIDSVHPQHRPGPRTGAYHYLFGFHDSTFECVAGEFVVEKYAMPLSKLLAQVCARLT
jgi:hypothetical protein